MSKDLTPPGELTPEQKRKARRQFLAYKNAWFKGAAKLFKEANDKTQELTSMIYELVLDAYAQHPRSPMARRNLFKSFVREGYEAIKSDLGITNLKDEEDGVPYLVALVSDLAAGLQLGVSPLEHTSGTSFRNEAQKQRAQHKARERAKLPGANTAVLRDAVSKAMVQTGVHDELFTTTQLLFEQITQVGPEHSKAAAKAVRKAVEALAPFVSHD